MPEIAAPDLEIIRFPYTGITDFFINIPLPTEICRAEIETTPTDYPLADLPVINTSLNWDDGIESMLVRIYDDTETILKFEGILRRNNEADLVRIAGIQKGDTGIAREFARSIQAEDIVIVYDVRIPKSFISRIDPDTEELLKRWDVEFNLTTPPTEVPKPQPNMGSHQCEKVNPTTGVATFVLSAVDSFSWNGNSLDFEWELPAGLTITVGTVNDDTITVEADPGEYNVVCRVEDSVTGEIKRGYRYIFAVDGDDYEAFSQRYAVTAIDSDDHSTLGRSLNITVKIDSTVDVNELLYTGSPVLMTYKHLFSEDAWVTVETPTEGTLIENYIGFIRRFEQIARDPTTGIDTYVIYVESALQYYAALPMPGQTVTAVASPSKWSEVATALANVGYWVFGYLADFQAPVISQLIDMYPGDFDAFEKAGFSSRGGDLLAALREGAGLVTAGNIGCTSDGRIYLKRHGCYEDDDYRDNDIAETMTLEPGDLGVTELKYNRDHIMQYGETEGGGFVTGTTTPPTTHTARAALYAQAQGAGIQRMDDFVGLNQGDIQDRVGHHHNFTNSPTKATPFPLAPGMDVFDPVRMEWVRTDLISLDPSEQQILNNKRWLPVSVSRTWSFEPNGITKQVTVTMHPETKGERAPLKPPPTPQPPEAPVVTCFSFAQNWTAIDINATPSGWSQIGTLPDGVDLGGAQSDFDACENLNAVRISDGRWNNGSWSGDSLKSCIGIKRVFNYPCTLTSAEFIADYDNVGTGTFRMIIYIRYASGAYEVLNSTSGTLAGSQVIQLWSGTKNNVKEIHFIARVNDTGAPPAGTWIRATKYNY